MSRDCQSQNTYDWAFDREVPQFMERTMPSISDAGSETAFGETTRHVLELDFWLARAALIAKGTKHKSALSPCRSGREIGASSPQRSDSACRSGQGRAASP